MFSQKTYILFLFIFSIIIFSGCEDNKTNDDKSNDIRLSVNYDNQSSQHILLPVSIQSNSYQFVLDTGTQAVIVDEKLRSLFNPILQTRNDVVTIENVDLEMAVAKPDFPIHIGESIVYRGSVGICDLSRLGVRYDGIIGMIVLQQFVLSFDFQKKRLDVLDNLSMVPKTGCFAINITSGDGYLPFMDMQFDGFSERFLIDTGLTGTGYLRKDTYFQIANDNETMQTTIQTVHGPRKADAVCVKQIFIGDIRYNNLSFISGNSSILGMEYLRLHKKVIMDFKDNKFYLTP